MSVTNSWRDKLPRSFRVWTLPPDRWGVYYQRRLGRRGWSFEVGHDVVVFNLRLSWKSSKESDRRRYEEYTAVAIENRGPQRVDARAS